MSACAWRGVVGLGRRNAWEELAQKRQDAMQTLWSPCTDSGLAILRSCAGHDEAGDLLIWPASARCS